MPIRTDSASRLIAASPEAIYQAFTDPARLMQWLPPGDMTGRALEFDAREGGRYSIELTYAGDGAGKTTGRTDVSSGTFLKLEPGRKIVWSVNFESKDPAFAGTMIMTWSLDPRDGGTEVTITAEDVPPAISKADHDIGLNSTLENLATFVEKSDGSDMQVSKIAAFSLGNEGGNPAGVALSNQLPEPQVMQRIAAEIGFSETAFAAPDGDKWRVRYFAPEAEVDFCGHATIALGAALALREGDGLFPLLINNGEISVEARAGSAIEAALQSPPTSSRPASEELVASALVLFSINASDLDSRIPPAIANAGVDHLVLALRDRGTLAAMHYDFAQGRNFMNGAGLVTISLVHAESPRRFHARNPFASGGVYEDPATGAAAAALGGYLRDIGWPHGGSIEIIQGEDMQAPSRLIVELTDQPGSSVRVSGTARLM